MTICLLVDSDLESRTRISTQLTRFGIFVRPADSARGMWAALVDRRIDIVLLDVILPDADGIDLCRQLRIKSAIPLVVIDRQADVVSTIIGLEMGADDYISKSCEPRELFARIGAVMRRTKGPGSNSPPGASGSRPGPAAISILGECQVDWRNRMLIGPEGVGTSMSNIEYRLLSAFTEHPDKVLTRDELVKLTHGKRIALTARSIDLNVSRLRAKLRESVDCPRIIQTVRGHGYRFMGDSLLRLE